MKTRKQNKKANCKLRPGVFVGSYSSLLSRLPPRCSAVGINYREVGRFARRQHVLRLAREFRRYKRLATLELARSRNMRLKRTQR